MIPVAGRVSDQPARGGDNQLAMSKVREAELLALGAKTMWRHIPTDTPWGGQSVRLLLRVDALTRERA
ncbi:MAG: hypothetical protein JNK47_23285 [Mesorhizobium sp.]|nr:hypothetical protein [Mesorhizobium sp.]MBL8580134.1 hypothetical protein [Mesorhizobium sp.]